MARALTIGNGNVLVGIDSRGQVRDFYFPYVGHANHVSGASGTYAHRVGVWVDGMLHWLSDPSWHITMRFDEEVHAHRIDARNDSLQVELVIFDVVHNEKNVFIRKFLIRNLDERERVCKVFFAQEFRISESRRGDTGFYDPRVHSIVHYKGHDAFLVHAQVHGRPFEEYTVGLFDIEGKLGSYRDAEDGVLTKNPIEHGSVDSVIGVSVTLSHLEETEVLYWIAAGHTINEVHMLHHYILDEGAENLMHSTYHYWEAWGNKDARDLSILDEDVRNLYKRSLEIIRVHTDNRGGIIASSDSDMLNQGRDSYSYVWPRDAAICAHALDQAGYFDTTERFYTFITGLMEAGGYLMHKYRVDGVLGSSWHPWVREGKFELPIQEDETALVVFMLGKHFERARDVEFIESLFNSFIEPAADFMCCYIEPDTGLPAPSYDLWEEKFGSSTYTASAVYGALNAAAEISAVLGKREHARKYRTRAAQVAKAIETYLYSVELGGFAKLVREEGKNHVLDTTIDLSSLHGLLFFEVLDHDDPRIVRMKELVKARLHVPTEFGGYMRYEGDRYYKTSPDAPPNAWCITTLWMAQLSIREATSRDALEDAYGIIRWTLDRATETSILPEQLHPYTGAPLSTAPLIWSHAEYVITVHAFLDKYQSLKST